MKCWGCVRINCAVIARRQLFVNRKSRIHGPRKVDAMIFFFLLKCGKRVKCYAIFIRFFSLTSETLSSSDRCTQFV